MQTQGSVRAAARPVQRDEPSGWGGQGQARLDQMGWEEEKEWEREGERKGGLERGGEGEHSMLNSAQHTHTHTDKERGGWQLTEFPEFSLCNPLGCFVDVRTDWSVGLSRARARRLGLASLSCHRSFG